MMKYDLIAAAFHILLVAVVWIIYASYPASDIPIPFFGMLTTILGFVYGVAGIVTLRDYVKKPVQAKFNMAVLMILVGGILFVSESVATAQ